MSENESEPDKPTLQICVVYDRNSVGERPRALIAALEAIRERSSVSSRRVIEFEIVATPGSPFLATSRAAGFRCHEVPLPPSVRFRQARLAATQLSECLAGSSIVHAVGATAAAYCSRAARALGSPIIWQLDDCKPRWPIARWIRRRTHCWIAPLAVTLSQCGIAPSHPFARMVPHVLRSDRIRTEARSSWGRACPPVVGMLGRFDLKENLHVFLGMARIVNARRPEARFLIASAIGPGEHPDRSYADSLGHLVKSYGLEDRVSFRARPNDLNDFFDTIDLFVEPSTQPGADYLGLLAMARGLPVIGTLSHGFPEIITSGDNGWLTLPRDARGLAKACQFLLGNPELALAMGVRARERISATNGLEVASARLESVYRELAGGGLSSPARRPVGAVTR